MTTAVEVMPEIRIEDVRVGERTRKDIGDLTTLRESIAEHGLLQPIVLMPDNYLLCGGRRLEACRQLGLDRIAFVRSTTQTDAISRLKAERDENTCRKDMTPSELVAFARKIEALKRPEAEQRRREGEARGRETRWNGSGSTEPEPSASDGHQTRREVAEAIGMSPASYQRAKTIVAAAENPQLPAAVREAAQAAVVDMDAGKISIRAADNKVKLARLNARGGQSAPEAKPTTPAAASTYGRRRKHLEKLDAIATGLGGYLIVLNEITELDGSIGKDDAARLKGGIGKAVTALNRINRLLEGV